MPKRESSYKYSDMDRGEKKKIRNVEQEPIKIDTTEHPENSELSYFIKNEKMLQVLEEKGIKRFFPVQYMTFDSIYNGKDVIARDRTGSGKTMAFALPIIERFRKDKVFKDNHNCKYLIVLPTRYFG